MVKWPAWQRESSEVKSLIKLFVIFLSDDFFDVIFQRMLWYCQLVLLSTTQEKLAILL